MRVLVPFGTRPEIVKLAPVVRALRAAGHDVCAAATGQHHDPELTQVFYDELGLAPDVTATATGTPAQRLGSLLATAVETVERAAPDVVLVLGDTHTVPCYCLAARGARIPVAHLEAGLRSFNPTSVEEVNRRVAAATASLHLAPTELSAAFLRREGVDPRDVHVVGNPVVDALVALGTPVVPLAERRGAVLTAHRATNVDDPDRLEQLVQLAEGLARRFDPVLFPVHPRTRQRLEGAGALGRLDASGVQVLPPLPYGQMLGCVSRSQVVVTDSGGLQEEASWLGVPVVVLRRSTPRWEGVTTGAAVLTGLDAQRALQAAADLAAPDTAARVAALPCPYGDGRTGPRVVQALEAAHAGGRLRLEEPDFVGRRAPC